MTQFSTAHEAKQFLISRIVEEAQREEIVLSEVERKMLAFSEDGPMSRDLEDASATFDRDYDQDVYEKKIASLIKNAARHDRRKGEYGEWWNAIRRIKNGDHYILVLIRIAGLRPPYDNLKLLGAALALAPLMMVFIFAADKYNFGKYVPSREFLAVMVWVAATAAGVICALVYWILGPRRFNDFTGGLTEKIFRKREAK